MEQPTTSAKTNEVPRLDSLRTRLPQCHDRGRQSKAAACSLLYVLMFPEQISARPQWDRLLFCAYHVDALSGPVIRASGRVSMTPGD